jgi:magnesium-protoporphyrin O-methyltransferase
MRQLLLSQLPADLRGARVLDAGCGTGALAFQLAQAGADVVAVDISPKLITIAKQRQPAEVSGSLRLMAGDMFDPGLGHFDHIVAMDSLIYYSAEDIGATLDRVSSRILTNMVFTVAPRTPLLMAMWRIGKLFPRGDRSPMMVPHQAAQIAKSTAGKISDIDRVTSGFYISQALEFRP